MAAAQVLHDEALRDGGAEVVGLRRRPHELLLPKFLTAHPRPGGVADGYWAHPILCEEEEEVLSKGEERRVNEKAKRGGEGKEEVSKGRKRKRKKRKERGSRRERNYEEEKGC